MIFQRYWSHLPAKINDDFHISVHELKLNTLNKYAFKMKGKKVIVVVLYLDGLPIPFKIILSI